MRWIAPASKDAATATLEKQLWAAADELRANSGLSAAQYARPVLGLIFLRFADAKYEGSADTEDKLEVEILQVSVQTELIARIGDVNGEL